MSGRMQHFWVRFPEIGPAETRCADLTAASGTLPAGNYAFAELYCLDPNCDCRRVVIQVLEKSDPHKVWATINFGWEPKAFYEEKFPLDKSAPDEITGASLDSLNPRSPVADTLLAMFREIVANDGEYVKRMERHYWMFKGTVLAGKRR